MKNSEVTTLLKGNVACSNSSSKYLPKAQNASRPPKLGKLQDCACQDSQPKQDEVEPLRLQSEQ
eukprot:1041738-Amphidinium_carterae.2